MAKAERYESGRQLMSDATEQRPFKPFTHALSIVLSIIALIFLISNIVFLIHCVPVFYNSIDSAACKIPEMFRFLDNIIPAIWRPVSVFEQAGNYKQAIIVRNVYEFSWGSTLSFGMLMVLVSLLWFAILSDDTKRQNRMYLEAKWRSAKLQERTTAKRGIIAILAIELMLLIDALYGDYAFDRIRPFADRVYVRASDFSWTSIELFLLLLGVVIGIMVCVRIFALKGAEKVV